MSPETPRTATRTTRADKDTVIVPGWEVAAGKWRYTAAFHVAGRLRVRTTPWLFVPVFSAALACAACAAAPVAPSTAPSVTLQDHRFTVEVANTPTEQAHGLMDRTAMAADHGMLFVFQDSEPRTFWMKDTLIPLDILFFDDAHRLVTILKDVPPCKADPCPVYPSGKPARYVLELNAGTATRIDAHTGDVLGVSDLPSGTQ